MKIIIVSTFENDRHGGGEVYSKLLAQELAKNHQVLLVSRNRDETRADYELIQETYAGLDIVRIIRNRLPPNGELHDPVLFQRFGDIVESFGPDIVHFNTLNGYCASLVQIPHSRSIPSVFTVQDFWWECSQINRFKKNGTLCVEGPLNGLNCVRCAAPTQSAPVTWPKRLLDFAIRMKHRLLGRYYPALVDGHRMAQYVYRDYFMRTCAQQVDVFVVPSTFVYRQFSQWGIPNEKMIISGWGIDVSLIANASKTPSPMLRFGFIGRIEPYKGIETLLQAFSMLNNSKAKLYVYGESSHRDYETTLRSTFTRNNIHFKGAFANSQVGEVLSEIDVLVIPSLCYETYSVVVREAFAAGTPVIASQIGALAEAIRHGVDGFLCEPGNPDELRERMHQFVEDPTLLQRMRENIGPVKTMKQHATEIEQIYCSLLKHKASHGVDTLFEGPQAITL